MPDFLIRCKGDPRYTVRLDDCSLEHAQIALETLRRNPFVPDGLEMERTDTAQEPSRSLVNRLFRRD